MTIVFLLLCLKSTAQEVDTTKKDFIPSAVRLGTDLSYVGISIFNDERELYELNADIDFANYFLVLDYGHEERVRSMENYQYRNEGNYFRVGIDVNFLYKKDKINVLFFGVRFAKSNFDDQLTAILQDDFYGPLEISRNNSGVSANWLELTTGVKVRIWKQLFLGYTARFKFNRNLDETKKLHPFDIPGYGRASEPSLWGLNYHIFYRIPFRKKK